ncbi:hypothetical protein CNE_BB2p01490 (plasmid) [Cupriavidus necator N-1]|uniref:YCII-related domain-containing protein n=2 Tax=Cupriavidus necator TaxID=106590 RepID=F8GYL9_CUPNN|nr:hypothetical protein CNE_BB2p01490 [Cupriavidus necator N-1]
MFIVELTYTQPLNAIEARLSEHRRFLDAQYARGLFLVSGPKNPRDGGVILVSGLIARNELDKLLREDPFPIRFGGVPRDGVCFAQASSSTGETAVVDR